MSNVKILFHIGYIFGKNYFTSQFFFFPQCHMYCLLCRHLSSISKTFSLNSFFMKIYDNTLNKSIIQKTSYTIYE